ncbi:MAG: MFS transporter [Acidobacteria bacterium]|nr:MFS transporter [Acidobacteriota bacterium]
MKKQILLSASLFHALTDAASVIPPMVFPILLGQGFLIHNYSQIGILSNLGLLTTLAVQFLVVRVSYRSEYRTLMALSGLGLCASLAVIPLARSFAALLALFLLLRIASSFYHPIVIAWVSKSRAGSGRELDDAMGIQSGSGNLGVGLAYLTVGFLAQGWGWKTPLHIWAVFGLLLAGLGTWALRGVSSRSDERPSLRPADWARSLRAIKRFMPGFFFGGAGWSVAVYYAPSLLNHRYGIPMGQTGLFLALWIGLGTLTGYGYGALSRRFGRKPVFMASLGGAAAALFLLGFAPSKGLAVAGLLLFGGFLLMTYPSLHTFVGSTVPASGQTMAFSWVSNIQLVSGAVVTLVSGVLSDLVGIWFPFVFTGVLTVAVFLFYAPRGAEFFGAREKGVGAGPLGREGTA